MDKLEFNIYSDSFRGARYVCELIENLMKASNYHNYDLRKCSDLFVLETDRFKLNFLPLSDKAMFDIINNREERLFKENHDLPP